LRRHLTPWRAVGALVVLLLLTALILVRIPSGQYVLLPDIAHPVAPLVKVEGARPPGGAGSIYFLDVIEKKASEFERLFPWIHSDATFEPANNVVPPCSTDQQAIQAQLQEMAFSQRVAATVALRRLGYHVVVRPTGVLVSQLIAGTNAPCKLQPMDIIGAVNGQPTPTIAALHGVLERVKPGAVVSLQVRRGGRLRTVQIRTVAVASNQALVGFAPEQAATFKLPIRVSIDAGNVGGPSAGLAFALEVMQKLGRNVTHGHRVAATGEMELDGTVAPIGGVRQKVVDAHKAKVDVLLVPAGGGNAETARRYAPKQLRVIPVRTFGQALRALATLPSAQ
jgi:PDZ domain-containing protein